MFEFRQYQTKSLTMIRTHYAKKQKKVMLHLATGGGKTVIFCEVLKGVNKKNKFGIIVVRGRKLVDQASKRLDREGVQHGVMMAGHPKYNPKFKIQVCSIDTLRSRSLRPKADLIVIDEAHLATSKSYMDFLSDYPEAYILAVTATPYTDKPLRHLAEVVVKPIGIQDLIDQGHLVGPRYFAPNLPDLSGVKTQTTSEGKDYNQKQLSEVMEQADLVGDIATHWLELAKGRPTIAFCVSVVHSKKLTEYLNSRGIRAEHVDANSSDKEREEVIGRLENGSIDIICNVGILCLGVDIPCVSCIVMARPTKSAILYIQQGGRGTRPFKDKKDFIILDHAGNVFRHGFLTDEKEANLEGKDKTKKIDSEVSPKQCQVCFAVFKEAVCPCCGNANESKIRQWVVADGNLKELKPEDLDPVKLFINDMKRIRKEKGYKLGWVYFQVKDKFGDKIADQYLPKRIVPHWITSRA